MLAKTSFPGSFAVIDGCMFFAMGRSNDFSEMMWPHEKLGGLSSHLSVMFAFRSAVTDVGLEGLGFSCLKFTLSKIVVGGVFVQEWLDCEFLTL